MPVPDAGLQKPEFSRRPTIRDGKMSLDVAERAVRRAFRAVFLDELLQQENELRRVPMREFAVHSQSHRDDFS
jgi:hypothetical protein